MTHILWYPGHELLVEDIVRAENCHLYDSKGKKYVDLESGVWCTSIGHGNPKVLRAIAEQTELFGHAGFNYTGQIVEQTARLVLELLGMNDGKCVFLCSGSEAVEYGVRVAQEVGDRPLLMTMADSYFGAYGSASARAEDEWFCFDWFPCADCPHGGGDCDGCDHWASIPFDRIGGFLLEPGSSSGLVRFPPKKIISNIARVIRSNGGLILVNEVTTGVGGTGEWFGFQHYQISPDIVALGKGIGNGYPVSVTALGPKAATRLGDEPLKYAQSHQNDPTGAAVVRAVIRAIRDDELIVRSRVIASILSSGLDRIKTRSSRVADVRSRGLMAAIELVDDEEMTFTTKTHRELLGRGYIVGKRPGINVLRLDPSLTVEKNDITEFLDVLENVLG